ncbi:MAG: B12-binding domain-containing radical SAM protein [Candidatus Omnitrophica bacterium]|nr:B12-binding domain-containing radical SAM protein [Candidatus Omnitrophota bacterium]MCB9720335.1 B12-binding domain-containing radical SAM protein [Candidatus Omnitrophota bacterium]
MNHSPKILLINTSTTMIKQFNYVYGYPVGLMSLAGYAREQGFDNITLLDFNVPGNFERLEEVFRTVDPDVVGLCGLTVDREGIEYTAEKVKQWNPGCVVLCGGPYASASYERVASFPFIDLVVVGEGELTFTEILQRCERGESLAGIRGTARRLPDGSVKLEPARAPIMDLDSLPLPAFDLADIEFYSTHQSMAATMGVRPYMALFSSRACPYRCTYCHDIFGKTFRALSAERMVEVIEHLIKEYGIRDFEFYDDIWNLDRDRVKRFCELVIAKKLDINYHFPNGLRTDRFTEELLELMAASGCRYFAVAVESPDKAIQKQIKKFNKMDVIRRNIAIADRLGIFTMGYFMVGFPGERYRQMLKTCWFMISSRLTVCELFSVTPFEGTEIYQDLEREKELDRARNQNFVLGAYHNHVSQMSAVPAWLVDITRKMTYLLTYTNPMRMWRIFVLKPYRGTWARRAVGLMLRIFGCRRIRRENFFQELRQRESARRDQHESVAQPA